MYIIQTGILFSVNNFEGSINGCPVTSKMSFYLVNNSPGF